MQKDDPLFGIIKFRRNYGFFGAGYWEGKFDFPPAQKSVEIIIYAGRSGIDQAHRNFYRELEQRYETMIPHIFNVLETNSEYLSERFGEPEWKDFELDSIYIINLTYPEPEWTLAYRYLPSDQIYYVYFEGWKPTHGKVDD